MLGVNCLKAQLRTGEKKQVPSSGIWTQFSLTGTAGSSVCASEAWRQNRFAPASLRFLARVRKSPQGDRTTERVKESRAKAHSAHPVLVARLGVWWSGWYETPLHLGLQPRLGL